MTTTFGSSLALNAVSYRIDDDSATVFFTLRGEVTFADLCEAQDALFSDPSYSPGMPMYVDCRVVTSIPTAEQIRKLALDRAWWSTEIPTGRMVIVAMTPLGFDYASMWETFVDEPASRFGIFPSHAAASEWLGIPLPPWLAND